MQDKVEIKNSFAEELATLFNTLDRLEKSLDLLTRCLNGQINFLLDRDNATIRIVLHHYIINSIDNLFDKHNRRVISFFRIVERFKNKLDHDFFTDYLAAIENFRSEHESDLAKINKNRDLWTGHLGSYQAERLGFDQGKAKNISWWYKPDDFIAKNDALVFIMPEDILDLDVVRDINDTKSILVELQLKLSGFKLPTSD